MSSLILAVIRMFGIFTHAQLGRGRFWDTLSRQLEHRGPDYVERCTFQNGLQSTGDFVTILPVVFPLLKHQVQDAPQAAKLDKVREEDIKNVSRMTG